MALEPYGAIPIIARGIRIRHNRQDYPETLVFWCLGSRDRVLADVLRIFTPAGAEVPRASGIAIKWMALLAAFLLWNLLLMAAPDIRGMFAALALMFAGATALQRSSRLQQLVLRPGHQAGEMKPYLILMQLMSAFLLAAFGLAALTGPVSTSGA